MQNPPPPPPSGGYPPPPPPPGGFPPPPPPSGGYPPPPPPAGGYPSAQPPGYAYAAAPQVTYGGFWIRFVAYIVDSVIIGIPTLILGVILGLLLGLAMRASGTTSDQTINTAGQGIGSLFQLILFVISIVYFVFFWVRGQTLGMRLFHLRVADANTGAPIGYGRAALRFLGYIISGIVCDIGLIWAAFDSRKQGWHDKMANTVVLHG